MCKLSVLRSIDAQTRAGLLITGRSSWPGIVKEKRPSWEFLDPTNVRWTNRSTIYEKSSTQRFIAAQTRASLHLNGLLGDVMTTKLLLWSTSSLAQNMSVLDCWLHCRRVLKTDVGLKH